MVRSEAAQIPLILLAHIDRNFLAERRGPVLLMFARQHDGKGQWWSGRLSAHVSCRTVMGSASGRLSLIEAKEAGAAKRVHGSLKLFGEP